MSTLQMEDDANKRRREFVQTLSPKVPPFGAILYVTYPVVGMSQHVFTASVQVNFN